METVHTFANTYFGDEINHSPVTHDHNIIPFEYITGNTHPENHTDVNLRGNINKPGNQYLWNIKHGDEWTNTVTGEV